MQVAVQDIQPQLILAVSTESVPTSQMRVVGDFKITARGGNCSQVLSSEPNANPHHITDAGAKKN